MRKSIAIILSALVLAGCASENTGSSANTETEAATLAPHEIKESSAAVVDNTGELLTTEVASFQDIMNRRF